MYKIKPVRTEADYEAALARIDALMDATPGSQEGEELDVLADLVLQSKSAIGVLNLPRQERRARV